MTTEHLKKMDKCRHLLPEPGPEVVGELVEALRAAQAEAKELMELIGLASTSFSMLEAYLGPQWFEAVSNMDLVGPDKVHARAALAKVGEG